MDLLVYFLFVHTFAAGILGIFVLKHVAAWKLSTESIESPDFGRRWFYRYLTFSFWFLLSFLSLGPLTTWQVIKLPEIQAFGRNHPWLIFALNIPPTMLLYYFYRKFTIWADARKIEGRKRLAAKLSAKARSR
ncbi:hypothetical protein [Pseudoxanthomonas sp. PXM04]|jgi:hypothetical protein|uniref:hypothetical protein n=1 Tax=Pseudoxanthomonas sp. PXM04 TaxID=2769297 RepID=UPI00177ED4A5|nr:hypothetical protein [Pseudoxanthomonas sp. PXM04]MBD9379249.1 hypothetical protein [Pseudoxanthomonas sp. PXM04]